MKEDGTCGPAVAMHRTKKQSELPKSNRRKQKRENRF
jgi:hypothetical protein